MDALPTRGRDDSPVTGPVSTLHGGLLTWIPCRSISNPPPPTLHPPPPSLQELTDGPPGRGKDDSPDCLTGCRYCAEAALNPLPLPPHASPSITQPSGVDGWAAWQGQGRQLSAPHGGLRSDEGPGRQLCTRRRGDCVWDREGHQQRL